MTLANILADYTSGWMVPLHESLLGLNEVDLFCWILNEQSVRDDISKRPNGLHSARRSSTIKVQPAYTACSLMD